MKEFCSKLRQEILKGLPGTEVQWAMASSDRLVKDFPRIPGRNAAEAAVLILLYPEAGTVCTFFIQRPQYKGVHGGQISFPGGKRETTDRFPVDTALREAHEEAGIDPSSVEIAGILTPLFIPVSNIVVTPVVGCASNPPRFIPDRSEVVYVIEAGLRSFLDYSILTTGPFEIRGEKIEIRYFDYKGHVIWGATAMILNELIVILNRGLISPEV